MNGASLKQQDVAASAAEKAGGYWPLVRKFALQVPPPAAAPDRAGVKRKVKMAVRVGDDGQVHIVQVRAA